MLTDAECLLASSGHRNCPKDVELYSKNKFEKLGHLVGFVIRIYHDTRSSECQIWKILNFISVVYWFSSIIDYDMTFTIYTMNPFLL